MSKRLVITEKPSVARDIAAALGGFTDTGEDYLESEDYVVTWALGHLVELAEPQDYDKALRSWSIKNLPIIPEQFKHKPREGQKKRLDLIKKLGRRKDVVGIINACDAGREGESIFRRIVEYTGLAEIPHERLWLQSMTPEAIREAFDNLRPGHDLDRLADAAHLRAIGDWLIGMNATRALTQRLKSRGERGSWSAGRVQTPTLNLLVEREHEILAHTPRPYWELVSVFSHGEQQWEGRWFDPALQGHEDRDVKPTRLFDRARVDFLVEALSRREDGLASETRKLSRQNPPLLFDLTSLQREANRRFSMSAKRTLDAAQRLYEGHKLLTYPRTDSRHLPEDYGPTVAGLLDFLATLPDEGSTAGYGKLAAKVVEQGPKNLERILDSSKVSDHFAIVPTGNPVERELSGDDARVFDLVVRQFLAALMGPATWATVERIVAMDVGESEPARFRTTARSLEVPGFLEALGQTAGSGTQLPPLEPGRDAVEGVQVHKDELRVEDKETRPPARYTEAQLLRMMETAGEYVDDEDLSDAMRGRGLGTPATRADTIERLVHTGYARRTEGKLAPTSKAMRLMDVLRRVDASGLASPQLTGGWFHALNEVEAGRKDRKEVEQELGQFTRDVVSSLTGFEHEHLYDKEPPLGTCPECGGEVIESAWGYPCRNNTGADSACNFIIWKDRAGRYIDRRLVRRLLEEGTVGPLDGFTDRAGRRYYTGTLTLKKDPEKERWILDLEYGDAEEGEGDVEPEHAGEKLWPCPEHENCSIIETNKRYVCEQLLTGEVKTGPQMPKIVCHREMAPGEAEPYFTEAARTAMIEGFISKRGRPFTGLLYRKNTGKHGFEFPPRAPKKKAEGAKTKAAAKTTKATKTTKAAASKSTSKTAAAKSTTSKAATAKSEKTSTAKTAAKTSAAKTTRKTTTRKKAATAEAPAKSTARKTTAKARSTARKSADAEAVTQARDEDLGAETVR